MENRLTTQSTQSASYAALTPDALHGTDLEWEKWGQQDPYFAVITLEKFRSANITPATLEEFFTSGRWHVDQLLDQCRRNFDSNFQPQRILDFGCGVGRLLVAFADRDALVVGVDVSQAMLDEARANCDRHHLSNVRLLRSDDRLSQVDGKFDLVHSSIVFQHIDIPRGRELFRLLLERLAPSGIGAIHVTYGKAYHAETYGQPPPSPSSPQPDISRGPKPGSLMTLLRTVLRVKPPKSLTSPPSRVPAPLAPATDPEMLMNSYPLSDLAYLMQTAGITAFHATFTNHGGELGVVLLFRKPPSEE